MVRQSLYAAFNTKSSEVPSKTADRHTSADIRFLPDQHRRQSTCSSNSSVQRLAPSGGAPNRPRRKSSVSYSLGLPERAISYCAHSTSPSRYALRVRQIVVHPMPRASMIWASGFSDQGQTRYAPDKLLGHGANPLHDVIRSTLDPCW